MKITTKGQVTIPQHIRKFLDVSSHAEVDFLVRDGEVVLTKVDGDSKKQRESRFSRLRGIKREGRSTEQWMAETRGE